MADKPINLGIDDKVPYTGATKNVNIGTNEITAKKAIITTNTNRTITIDSNANSSILAQSPTNVDNFVEVKCLDGQNIKFGIGASGVARGIYDVKNSKWLYNVTDVSGTNHLINGNLTVGGNITIPDSSSINFSGRTAITKDNINISRLNTNNDNGLLFGTGTSANSSILIGISSVSGEPSHSVNCIALGNNAKASALTQGSGYSIAIGESTFATGDYSVALGYDAHVTASKTMRLGADNSNYFSSLISRVSITVSSDIRDKADIENIDQDKALEFINSLTPITYVDNPRANYYEFEKNEDGSINKEAENYLLYSTYGVAQYNKEEHAQGTKKGHRRQIGFSAQEVYQNLQDIFGSDNYVRIVDNVFYDKAIPLGTLDKIEDKLTMSYERMVPMLVGAIKALQAKNNSLQEQIKELKEQINLERNS